MIFSQEGDSLLVLLAGSLESWILSIGLIVFW